jgi:DNA repair protein RadC
MFFVLFLDNKHRMIHKQMITQCILNQSIVHARKVFAPAHNHPSGEVDPSDQDVEITKSLCTVGELIGIKALYYLIIGKDYFSL